MAKFSSKYNLVGELKFKTKSRNNCRACKRVQDVVSKFKVGFRMKIDKSTILSFGQFQIVICITDDH